MRSWRLLLLVPMLAAAQAPSGGALVRGVLLERDAQTASGEFSVRAADNLVFRYRFDSKTYVERENDMIAVAQLKPGDKIEVVSDAMPGAALRYAITIHVMAVQAPPRSLTAGRYRAAAPRNGTSIEERLTPMGDLSYSGVVYRISGARMVLHMREGGDRTILLRQDTRYLDDGTVVAAAALKPNMRVFVRAGKTLYDEVEAYQVVWGRIMQP